MDITSETKPKAEYKAELDAQELKAELERKIETAIAVIQRFGGIDGAHHKNWVLDQALRCLMGPSAYRAWRGDIEEEYDYDEGIAP
jgi:hypothetical protein